jgi:hypothetical protein
MVTESIPATSYKSLVDSALTPDSPTEPHISQPHRASLLHLPQIPPLITTMKFFSFAFVALAAFSSLVWAMDSATVITDMQTIANLTAQANQMASELTADNVLSQGPVCCDCCEMRHRHLLTLAQEVIQSLEQITNVVNDDTQAMLVSAASYRSSEAFLLTSLPCRPLPLCSAVQPWA